MKRIVLETVYSPHFTGEEAQADTGQGNCVGSQQQRARASGSKWSSFHRAKQTEADIFKQWGREARSMPTRQPVQQWDSRRQQSPGSGLPLISTRCSLRCMKQSEPGCQVSTWKPQEAGGEVDSLLERHCDGLPAETRWCVLSTCPESAEKIHRDVFTTQGENFQN